MHTITFFANKGGSGRTIHARALRGHRAPRQNAAREQALG